MVKVNPTTSSQPEGPRFYIGVTPLGTCFNWILPCGLSGLGDPAGSSTTAGIASCIFGTSLLNPAWVFIKAVCCGEVNEGDICYKSLRFLAAPTYISHDFFSVVIYWWIYFLYPNIQS